MPGDLLCEDVVDRGVGRWHACLLFGNIVYRVCGVGTLWRGVCVVKGCGGRGRILCGHIVHGDVLYGDVLYLSVF